MTLAKINGVHFGNTSHYRRKKGELTKPVWIKKEPMSADFLSVGRAVLPLLKLYLQGKLAGYPMTGYNSYSLGEDSAGAEKVQLFREHRDGSEEKVAVIVFEDSATAVEGAAMVDELCGGVI